MGLLDHLRRMTADTPIVVDYTRRTDAQLQQLWRERPGLTPEAAVALEAELDRRNVVHVKGPPPPPPGTPPVRPEVRATADDGLRLLQAFGALRDELALNREGTLSPRQLRDVVDVNVWDAAMWTVIAAIMTAVCAWVAYAFGGRGDFFSGRDGPLGGVVLLLVLVGVPGALIALAVRAWVVFKRARLPACVTHEGVARLTQQAYRGHRTWSVTLGEVEFPLTERVHAAFVEGARYRAYYVLAGKMMVLAEPV